MKLTSILTNIQLEVLFLNGILTPGSNPPAPTPGIPREGAGGVGNLMGIFMDIFYIKMGFLDRKSVKFYIILENQGPIYLKIPTYNSHL